MSGSTVLSVLGSQDPQLLGVGGADNVQLTSSLGLTQINNFTKLTRQVCETNCIQTISDVTVIVSPGATVGPVTFSQQCTISDVNCALNSLVDESVKSTLTSLQTQTQTFNNPNLMSGFGLGISKPMIKQSQSLDVTVKNNLLQLISQQCTFETEQKIANNYVFIGEGATTGAVSFVQNSSLSGLDCATDVIAKHATYVNQTTQKSAPSTSLFNLFLVLMVFVLMLSSVIFIVFIVAGGDAKISTSKYALKKSVYDEVRTATARPPVSEENLPLLAY